MWTSFSKYFFFLLFVFVFFLSPPLFSEDSLEENPDQILVEETPTIFVEADFSPIPAPQETFSADDKPTGFVTLIDLKKNEAKTENLSDLLSEQPGVDVRETAGEGQFSTFSIRGSSSDQVSVFWDGVKINTAQGGVDLSMLPLDAIDRIEVIRGASSAQFGSDAVGGAIHLHSRKAKKKTEIEASVAIGSFETWKTSWSISKRFKKSSFFFHHRHLSSAGDFTFVSTPVEIGGKPLGGGQKFKRENNGFWNESTLLRFDISPSDVWKFSFISSLFGSKREVPPTEEEFIQLAPLNPPEAKESIFRGMHTFWMDRFLSPKSRIRFQPFYSHHWSHFTDPSPALASLGSKIDVTYNERQIGFKIGFEKASSALEPEATSDSNLGEKDPGPDLISPKTAHHLKLLYEFRQDFFQDQNAVDPLRISGEHRRYTHGFYLSDQISFFHEHLFINPAFNLEKASGFQTHAAAHLGIAFLPKEDLIIKANVENAFRFPNFSELFFPDQGVLRGNPNLLPEKALHADVGVQWRHRFGDLSLGYFSNRIENSIVFVPISAFTIAPVNTGRVRTQGIEWVSNLSPFQFLDLHLNYTFLSSKLEQTDWQLPGRPRHKLNAKLTVKNKRLAVYAKFQWIDQLPIDFQNKSFIRHRGEIDLGATVKFSKHLYASVECKNITNVHSLDERGFPLPGFSVLGALGTKW